MPVLHNLPPKRPQTSLFFPTATWHHRTAGPQTHKCCNYLSLFSILFFLYISPLSSSSLLAPLPISSVPFNFSLFPGNQPSLEASGEDPSSPRSAAANHNGLSEAWLSSLSIFPHLLAILFPSSSFAHLLHQNPQLSGPSLLLLSPAEVPGDALVTVFHCGALASMSTLSNLLKWSLPLY